MSMLIDYTIRYINIVSLGLRNKQNKKQMSQSVQDVDNFISDDDDDDDDDLDNNCDGGSTDGSTRSAEADSVQDYLCEPVRIKKADCSMNQFHQSLSRCFFVNFK